MKTLILFIAIATISLFSSCDEVSSSNKARQIYKYTGYDSSWNKIITGYLWVDSIDSVEVKGRWDFKLVNTEENFGPQIGSGNFEGHKDTRGSMQINLNPDLIDNNVVLDGSLLNSHYDGSWSYIGFPGLINCGRFEAIQIR
jgi:hypothetical protein